MKRSVGLKNVDTIFDGYKFRSRLEARWAVFFKTLGIKYEYEKEGFELPCGWYLPDFWLPNEKTWVEIKPVGTSDESLEAFWLAEHTSQNVLLVTGNPWPDEYNVQIYSHVRFPDEADRQPGEPMQAELQFAEDRKVSECLWLGAEHGAHSLTPSDHPKHGDQWPMQDTQWLQAAYGAARQARFEHEDKWSWTTR